MWTMGQPAKRVTSSDVARAAGVSRTTVSFVLNGKPGWSIPEETRNRVMDAARQLQYRPRASARALAAGYSDIVLLAVPDLPMGEGIAAFIEELADALAGYGLTLVTHLAGANARPLPDVCATLEASAVTALESFSDEMAEALHQAGAKVVLPVLDPAPAMRAVGGMQAACLIGGGRRRLGYALPAESRELPMARQRLEGAVQACAAAGVEPPVALELGLDPASAERAVAAWAEQSVTGVCAYNDEYAMAVLSGARARGLAVPGDLAVVGADDIPVAPLAAPPLTTVAFDLREAGRHRAEAIATRLRGQEQPPERSDSGPRLIRRESA
jgi:DNA-binding LacI/PurR family transcriptional regulator